MNFISQRSNLFVAGLLIVAAFLVFYKTLFFGFFSDDYHFLYITATQESVLKYLFTNNVGEAVGGSYGPMMNFLFSFEFLLFKTDAIGYHVVTLVTYVLTAFFIYLFATKISGQKILGFFASVLFIVLQSHVEAVSWIAVQPHVFATLFFVAGLYSYFTYLQSKKRGLYLVSFLLMAISIYTKESAIMFFPVLILIEAFFGREGKSSFFREDVHALTRLQRLSQFMYRQWTVKESLIYVYTQTRLYSIDLRLFRTLARIIPFAVLVLVFIATRYAIVGYVAGYYGNQDIGVSQILLRAKMFVELSLQMIVSSPYRQLMSEWFFRHEFIFVVCAGALVFLTHFASRTHRRALWFLLLTYICVVLPFTFLQFDPLTNSGERYTYTISVFFVLYLVMLIYAVLERFKRRTLIFGAVLSVLITGSLIQLYPKLRPWQYSAQVRDAIISQFDAREFNQNDYLVFLALPDNVEGAELFRNAMQEAIAIETGHRFIVGERIPMYLEPRIDQIGKKMFELDETTNGVYTFSPDLPERRVFTGFYAYSSSLVKARMDKFMAYGQSGTDITVSIRPHILELYQEQGKTVYLTYFDGEQMNFLELN